MHVWCVILKVDKTADKHTFKAYISVFKIHNVHMHYGHKEAIFFFLLFAVLPLWVLASLPEPTAPNDVWTYNKSVEILNSFFKKDCEFRLTPSFSFSIKTFFSATFFPVCLCFALNTSLWGEYENLQETATNKAITPDSH